MSYVLLFQASGVNMNYSDSGLMGFAVSASPSSIGQVKSSTVFDVNSSSLGILETVFRQTANAFSCNFID